MELQVPFPQEWAHPRGSTRYMVRRQQAQDLARYRFEKAMEVRQRSFVEKTELNRQRE